MFLQSQYTKLVIISILFLSLASCNEKKVKIACVGDYITSGSDSINVFSESYPAILAQLLGSDFEVMNFGVSDAKINKECTKAYHKSNNYRNIQIYNPDIIILMLGSNDAIPTQWDRYASRLKKDYEELLTTFQGLSSSPDIYICTPICSFQNKLGIDDYTVSQNLSTMIRKIAKEKSLQLIDLNAIFPINQSLFFDNVNPDVEGNEIIAKEIYKIITTNYSLSAYN